MSGLLIICVVALAVLISVLVFQVDGYEVRGSYHQSEQEVVESLMQGTLGHNSLYLTLTNRGRKISGNTFIDTITVNMKGPRNIEVVVEEKPLVGYVFFDDHYWYFDRTGMVQVLSTYSQADYNLMLRGGIPNVTTGAENENTAPADSASAAPPEEAASGPRTPAEAAAAAEEEAASGQNTPGEETSSGPKTPAEAAAAPPEEASSGPRTPAEAAAAAEEEGTSGQDPSSEESGADVIAPQELAAVSFFGRLTPPIYLESYEGQEEESEIYSGEDESEDYSEDYSEEGQSEESSGDEDYSEGEEYSTSDEEENSSDSGDETITFSDEEDGVIAPVVITGEETEEGGEEAAETETSSVTETPARSTAEDMLKSESGAVLVYIPLVEGLSFTRIELGQTIPGQNSRIFDMLDTFREYVLNTGNVPDRIVVGDKLDLSVHYGGAEVRLGTGDYLEERLNELKYIHPHLAGLTGILHLENFDGSQDEVIFSKK